MIQFLFCSLSGFFIAVFILFFIASATVGFLAGFGKEIGFPEKTRMARINFVYRGAKKVGEWLGEEIE